jgi:hypothetical protein
MNFHPHLDLTSDSSTLTACDLSKWTWPS